MTMDEDNSVADYRKLRFLEYISANIERALEDEVRIGVSIEVTENPPILYLVLDNSSDLDEEDFEIESLEKKLHRVMKSFTELIPCSPDPNYDGAGEGEKLFAYKTHSKLDEFRSF